MKFFNLFSVLLILSISCTKTPSEELTEMPIDENVIKYENLTNCDNYIETQITSLSFIKNLNISSTGGIQEVYVKNNDNLVLISPGNRIVEIKC